MAFDGFGKIFSKKDFLGVDIGTTSIKIVELGSGKKLPAMKNYAFLENQDYLNNPKKAIQSSTVKISEKEAAEFLRILIEESGIKTKDAAASIPGFSAFATLLELPLVSLAETAKAMDFQIKQYIPVPLSEVSVDWVKVGERTNQENPTQQIFLVSVANETVAKYQNIFKAAGLNLAALEIEGLSLARVLTADSDETTLIIDIGARGTTILIAQGGFLKVISQTDFAGASLTQNLASGLKIPVKKAEELKRQQGLGGMAHQELSTLIQPILNVIMNSARQVKENFEGNYKERIERIILSGGGANLKGIEEYCKSQFNLPVTRSAALSFTDYPSKLEPLVNELSPSFSVAVGLAMRNL